MSPVCATKIRIGGKVAKNDPVLETRVQWFLKVSESAAITNIREGKADFLEYVMWLKSLLPPYGK